ncbi:MAG: 50S ribosomal protein L1 [Legionellales bacterium]|nr:50S ribosomal protein L1 [Legionellales bacterium]
MATLSKRMKAIQEQVVPGRVYSVREALELLKKLASAKFIESVDLSVNLGIDARKVTVRGATVLPNGTGKTKRVAVFAQGALADAAKAAGADLVGFEDLGESIKAGNFDFDILIASPDSMRIVGQLGQILGPRGLMPNPKVGTVTADVAGAVQRAKAGQITYRAEKGGIVHCTIGNVNFTVDQLKENLENVVAALKKAKPSTSKGIYLKKIAVSTTMGPGLVVDISTVEAA